MKKVVLTLLLLVAMLGNLIASETCNPRAGLPNFAAKMRANQPVGIAYLGGSITEQSGWRVQSFEYFQKLNPNARQIHAAIGGTGSFFGALRLKDHVLKHQPDLVFVEFAVNDGDPKLTTRSMEGIVRQIWQANPSTDICFVYTLTKNDAKILMEKGRLKKSVIAMEKVADHYGIPTVFFAPDVLKELKAGKLIFSVTDVVSQVAGDELNRELKNHRTKDGKIIFSRDGVHPSPSTGHKIYTATLIKALETEIYPASGNQAAPHVDLPKLMSKDPVINYEQRGLSSPYITTGAGVEYREYSAKSDGATKVLAKRHFPCWKLAPGATVEFSFKGSQVIVLAAFGPASGKMTIAIDGETKNKMTFDRYCTWWRTQIVQSSAKSSEKQLHKVKITICDDEIDKRGILGPAAKKLDQNPEQFAARDCYIGAIFVDGEFCASEAEK